MLNADGTKHCPRCGSDKPPGGNFYRTGRTCGDGFTGYCILCTKEAATEWQKAMPEDRRRAKNVARSAKITADPVLAAKRRESVKRWADAHPEECRAQHRRTTAKLKADHPEVYRQKTAVQNNRRRFAKLGLPNSFQWVDWLAVLNAFKHLCAFCGAADCLLDLEHLVPAVQHGPNVPGNVVPACRPCNAQKNGRTLVQFAALRGLTDADLARIRETMQLAMDFGP